MRGTSRASNSRRAAKKYSMGRGCGCSVSPSQRTPTFITTFKGEDEPLVGRAWVDPSAGRLFRVEITVAARGGSVGFTMTINVTFHEDPRLRLWVPATMTERYTVGARDFATGTATYTDYRRFGVETKEELAK